MIYYQPKIFTFPKVKHNKTRLIKVLSILLVISLLCTGSTSKLVSKPIVQGVNYSVSAKVIPNVKKSQKNTHAPQDMCKKSKKIPLAVKLAILKYGRDFLVYEVRGGNLADQEFVLAVLMNRLIIEYSKRPTLNDDKLMERVARRWNPGLHKSLWGIRNNIKKKPILALFGSEAVLNAVNNDFRTKAGRFAFNEGVYYFCHCKGKNPWGARLKLVGNSDMFVDVKYAFVWGI